MTDAQFFQTISAYKTYISHSVGKGEAMPLDTFQAIGFTSWEQVWESHEQFNAPEEKEEAADILSCNREYTIKDLRAYCKEHNIEVTGDKRKKQSFIDAINAHFFTEDITIDYEEGVIYHDEKAEADFEGSVVTKVTCHHYRNYREYLEAILASDAKDCYLTDRVTIDGEELFSY
jgi:hypothetical protein